MGKLILDMKDKHYHKADAISRSDLVDLRTLPAARQTEKKETNGMVVGTACHWAILEPGRFESNVLTAPCKTTAAKAYQIMAEANPEMLVVPEGVVESAKDMRAAVLKHPKAKALLELQDAIAEPSYFWKDEDTGLWCKTRPDMAAPKSKIMADLKFVSAGKADPRKFSWSIRDFGYDLQAAWAIYGAKMATGVLFKEFWFIVCEQDAPHRVAVYQLDEEWLGDAMWKCKELLAIEAACKEAGAWPNFLNDNIDGETLFYGI